jgi:hypothetical protein
VGSVRSGLGPLEHPEALDSGGDDGGVVSRRSSSAVVSFSSPPNTFGHSAKARLVVMSTLTQAIALDIQLSFEGSCWQSRPRANPVAPPASTVIRRLLRHSASSGDTLVVAADFESSGAAGVNGNQTDDSALNAGAVHVFR